MPPLPDTGTFATICSRVREPLTPSVPCYAHLPLVYNSGLLNPPRNLKGGGRCLNALGTHLLLDLNECNPQLLDDMSYIRRAMMSAAEEAGATIVGENFHKFNPVGVTGIIAIAESHLCIHTWPEHGFAAVDIFTCGSRFKAQRAVELIIQRLQCAHPAITEVQRGRTSQVVSAPV